MIAVVNVMAGLVNSALILTSWDLKVLVRNGVPKLEQMGVVRLLLCFSDTALSPACYGNGFAKQQKQHSHLQRFLSGDASVNKTYLFFFAIP